MLVDVTRREKICLLVKELHTTILFCSGSEGCRTKPNDGRGPTAGEPRKEPLQQHPAM